MNQVERKATRTDEILGTMEDFRIQLISINERLNAIAHRVYGPRPCKANGLEKAKEITGFLEKFKNLSSDIFDILEDNRSQLSEIEEFI